MRSRFWRQTAISLVLLQGLGAVLTQRASADPFTNSEDFSKFGVQENFSCGNKGACGAVSTVNSFIYLEKQYPTIYDNKLTPNYDSTKNTDMMDAQKFGFDGWQVGTNPARQGNYNRPGDVREQVYLDTKKDWVNDYAPGTTVFDSWFAGSADHDRKPTIDDLAKEMKDKEDVEFWVKGTDFYHVLLLTEVSCDMAKNCGIRYQDPNSPTTNQPSTPITVMDGMLMFTDVPGSDYKGTVTITAAFAESPKNVPEPSTIVMLLTAAAGFACCRGKRRG